LRYYIYEEKNVKLPGKTVKVMHREYGVAESSLRTWARENNVPFLDNDGGKVIYYYDTESEERFKNRKKYPGRQRDEGIVLVAEQFRVSKQCVRNWAKKIGLPKDENGYIIGEKEIELFKNRSENMQRGRPRKEKIPPVWKPPVMSAKGLPLGRPRKQQSAPLVEAKKEKPEKVPGRRGRPRKGARG
jgi:ribosomal protein S14